MRAEYIQRIDSRASFWFFGYWACLRRSFIQPVALARCHHQGADTETVLTIFLFLAAYDYVNAKMVRKTIRAFITGLMPRCE